ncbi:acyl-CoA dehydrogenase family protein [Enterovirga rhinocerotis]|uniref:Alkylation response protein AidB-like acyl-CoA dehydrogenase n=1 Tax=Enterovirga rhinocerotis TaxID=1339210 RepID=A0A4R7BYL6_9HYPH|nr:acyl-CoA dehydrogenase family protein [Enterovirga rhinocerotis]TDR90362.1 alkylation response protein AidB-like acyl-CoA dehydrogenase [Enterovirga rhinocerotis]
MSAPIDSTALWLPYVEPGFVEPLRTYVRERIEPEADRIDREDVYPTEIMKALARDGHSTVILPEEFGGRGLGYEHAAALCEEVSVASAAVGVSLITIFQCQTMLRLFGLDSLKQRYLPAFADGLLSSYALTEARHGSDIRSLDTKARREGDEWIVKGEKHFITSGSAAEFFVILAETDKGVSVFAVPRDAKGVSIYEGQNSATFGLRNGPHMNVVFDEVRLPFDHMVGEEGKGVRQAATVLNHSRTLAGAVSLGIARAAFEGALRFARDRVAFDQRVLEFQGIQWYFAEMLTEIDAARLLIYRATEALNTKEQVPRFGSEAKLKASTVATAVATQAAQICGAYGIMENAPFGRYLRDAKAYEVAGGSNEVLKNTIAKMLLPIAGLDPRRKTS